jgi:hypothetical protein
MITKWTTHKAFLLAIIKFNKNRKKSAQALLLGLFSLSDLEYSFQAKSKGNSLPKYRSRIKEPYLDYL